MKKLITLLFMMALAVPAAAGNYNYVSQEKVKHFLEAKSPVMIVDIQVEEEFSAHHLKGSMPTYAYPVKTDAERAKLDQAVVQAKGTRTPVVIVCPRGKGGAKRGYDYMADQGIAPDRLLILEKGMGGWPYPGLVEKE